ncbi:hypothetical protein HU200_016957 [Digitaria exilis]|uniref:WAT1-related protein n=1 Tax=Digitaria exilis TaxID=1010633 RepID=A0A835F710_9POAL|nr:hypothetical protein HU200_016957 [Digitaria exilis]
MILVELINSGTILLGKVAVDQGIFVFALLCYRSSLGAIFTFPFALLFEKNKWKQLNWAGFKWLLLNSFVGYTLPMAMYYYGLRDTTATYTAIFSSLTPLVTFILSVMFSMEKLVKGTKSGTAKDNWSTLVLRRSTIDQLLQCKGTIHLYYERGGYPKTSEMAMGRHQLRGTTLLVGDCISTALWYPIQWKLHELYPWKLWSTYFTCILGGLQTLIIGLAITREPLAWKIGWNLQMLTIVYSAALGMAMKYCLNIYVVSKRGPAYTSMFSSLSVIFTMLGALLLGEKVTFGR